MQVKKLKVKNFKLLNFNRIMVKIALSKLNKTMQIKIFKKKKA